VCCFVLWNTTAIPIQQKKKHTHLLAQQPIANLLLSSDECSSIQAVEQHWMELVAMCMRVACCAAEPAASTTRLVWSRAVQAYVPSMVSAGGLLRQLLCCCAFFRAIAVHRTSSMTCCPWQSSVHSVRWCSRSVDGVADCGRLRAVLAL
jgi:hypothetical protein